VLHDPVLAQRAEDKVSFLDMFHSSDFQTCDFERLNKAINLMGDALLWWKDATLEALALHPVHRKQGDVANVGPLGMYRFMIFCGCVHVYYGKEHRVKLLGGWVYKVQHEKSMGGEGWMVSASAMVPQICILDT
jgi:hypothetical protein